MMTGDLAPRVSPDEARDAAAAVAARIPHQAMIAYKRCGHTRAALSGPSRTLDERCRDCLKERGTFQSPDAIPFINFRLRSDVFRGQGVP